MDVRCERCATEYELDDDSVPAGGCPVQCTSCGHTFTVNRGHAAPAGEPMPSPPAADWLLETSDGRLHRFRNLTSLQKWIIERKVTREDKISRTGQAWRRLGEIVELAPFFDVVDEADRARAGQAGSHAEDLKAEAQRARRAGSARPSPVAGGAAAASPSPAVRRPTPAARHSSSQEMAGVDAWAADGQSRTDESGEFDTSVVRNQRRGVKLTVGILLTAAVAVAVWFLVDRFGTAGKVSPGASALTPVVPTEVSPEPAAPPPRETPTPSPPVAAAPPVVPAKAPTSPGGTPTASSPAEATGSTAVAAGKAKAEASEGEAPASYDKMVSDADRLLENGATDRALKLYERALKVQPHGVDALTGMAYATLDKDRVSLAIGFFERALTQAPSYGPAMFGLAEALRAQGQEARALEVYRRYLQINAAGADAPAARRQLRLLEDKMGAAEPTRAASPPPSGPPPSPSSVVNEAEAP